MLEFLLSGFFYYILFNFVFYLSNLVLYLIDTNYTFVRRKIQPKPIEELIAVYKKCLPVALKNTFIYNLPAVVILPIIINWYGFNFSWGKTIFDLLMSYILMDFVYYITHRALHLDCFYTRFHKKHHEITAPIGLAATYLTVVDFYSNIFSIYLPPIILSADHTTMTIWVIISTLNTVFIGHSGYSPIASFHDNHHEYFNYNYGVGVFSDNMFNTKYVRLSAKTSNLALLGR